MNTAKIRQESQLKYKYGNINGAIQSHLAMMKNSTYQQFHEDYEFLGLLHFAKGDYAKSITIMEKGYKIWPDNNQFPVNIAVNFSSTNQYTQAIEWAEKALVNDPNNAVLYDILAKCYGLTNRIKKAKIAGEKSLTIKDQICASKAPETINKKIPKFDINKPEENIIAFSLWGNKPCYVDSAIKNARLIPHIYPGWTMRVYCEKNAVKERIVSQLISLGVQIIFMPNQQLMHEGLFWRFFVANDNSIKRFLVRDIDSIVNIKEKIAVDEWISSDKHFHLIRDYFTHTDPILAGLWGGISGILPDFKSLMSHYLERVNKNANCDQAMLRTEIWPLIKQSTLIHDSLFTVFNAKPFPKQAHLPSNQHIGQNHFAISDLTNFKPGKLSLDEQHIAKRKKYIFTISTGNTDSTFLANLFKANINNAEIHHEHHEVDMLKIHTPGRSNNALFNTEGNTLEIRQFWQTKFSTMLYGSQQTYIETTGLLSKAGLIENLDLLGQNVEIDIIILNQDAIETAWNIYNHFDFTNIEFTQYFHLDPSYPNNIVPFDQFPTHYPIMTKAYWLTCEMRARASYYQQICNLKSNIHCHTVNVEELTQTSTIKTFLQRIGLSQQLITVLEREEPTQQSFFSKTEKKTMETLINNIIIDPELMGINYYKSGRRIA
ncbi:MAG: tetratricopeptide repeat protein [Methylococcales bacterium]|nr:tetratricopeptide repeat protein [Methylococcales bacterium]